MVGRSADERKKETKSSEETQTQKEEQADHQEYQDPPTGLTVIEGSAKKRPAREGGEEEKEERYAPPSDALP